MRGRAALGRSRDGSNDGWRVVARSNAGGFVELLARWCVGEEGAVNASSIVRRCALMGWSTAAHRRVKATVSTAGARVSRRRRRGAFVRGSTCAASRPVAPHQVRCSPYPPRSCGTRRLARHRPVLHVPVAAERSALGCGVEAVTIAHFASDAGSGAIDGLRLRRRSPRAHALERGARPASTSPACRRASRRIGTDRCAYTVRCWRNRARGASAGGCRAWRDQRDPFTISSSAQAAGSRGAGASGSRAASHA
jgi:hypothetical protein